MKSNTWSAMILSLVLVSMVTVASGIGDEGTRPVLTAPNAQPAVPAIKRDPAPPVRGDALVDAGGKPSSTVSFEFSGSVFGLTYKGVVSSNTIVVTAQFMGVSYTFTLPPS